MRFSAALVAGFAAITSAFLIPLEVANDVPEDSPFKFGDTRFKEEVKHKIDTVTSLIAGRTEIVLLDCPSCPFASGYDTAEDKDGVPANGIDWVNEVESVISLAFSTDGPGLQLNSHTIFPFEEAQKAGTRGIMAWQIRMDTGAKSVEFPINFVFEALPTIVEDGVDGVSIQPVKVTVLGLNGIPVKVNTILVDLIKNDHDNTYKLARTRQIPFVETPGAESCEGAAQWSFCRIKAIIASQLKTMMEAAKERAHKVNGWIAGKKHGGCRKGGASRTGRPHHGKHHHHHSHRLSRVFRQVLRFVIIPAMLGIIGGLTASALGMLVGQAVVYLWHRNYRRGQRGPIRVVEQEIIIVEGEKDGLLSEQLEEEPPRYQDEIEVVVADGEKQ